MKRYHKKIRACASIVTFILFSYALSLAQTENIKGVQFKDGSIIYGKVIKMNVNDIQLETKDGKIISRKFNDVDIFIKDTSVDAKQDIKKGPVVENILKTDVKEERPVQKKYFNIAIGTEKMSGNTAYQIGYPFMAPSGTQYGYFPFSELKWPLDIWLARFDAGLNIGDFWRINGVFKKNLSDPGSNMKDSDWITDSNPSRLDIYSESNISKFDLWNIDVDVEWDFLKRQSWSLYAGLGYQYQKIGYEAKLIHQYSPSGLPGYEAYGDGRVAITYDITYSMPYLKIGADFKIKDKFTLAGSFAWSPFVKAKDEDHHLLRENGGKICTGNMDGNAYMVNLSAQYNFTPSWFLKSGFYYTKIDVDGEQYQIYGNGVSIGTVKEKSESTQTSLYLTVGYIF
ncbi:MAG: omptin family outer membrane protease [Smithellaceae bacterium]